MGASDMCRATPPAAPASNPGCNRPVLTPCARQPCQYQWVQAADAGPRHRQHLPATGDATGSAWHSDGPRSSASGRASSQSVGSAVGVPVDVDPRYMPARGIHARKGLVEARRQCLHSESARPLGMPYDLGAVTEYHRGPRPGRRVNQRLADEHTGLALRLQAVGVRWKTACPVFSCFAPGVPENRRRAASCWTPTR